MPNETQEFIRQRIKRINQIFEEFSRKIDFLKSEQTKIIKQILARVEKEKIEKILKEVKNK